MSIHDGHRARLRERFAAGEMFDDVQLLELLLCYAIPQGDVRPLAQRLLQRFGSFSDVLDAPAKELIEIQGVGARTAQLIAMFPKLFQRYAQGKRTNKGVISSSADAGDFLLPYFYGARNECVFLVCLDAIGNVLTCDMLAQGDRFSVALRSEQVLEMAQRAGATSVLLAHNHTDGSLQASQADVSLTISLKQLLSRYHIALLDHLIIADDLFASMAESGCFTD